MHPTRLGLVCENVELTSEDGKKISAWWLPNGREGKPPVLVLHGLGASKAHMMDYILFAQREGYPVMAIDFRGHGESDPSLTSIGFHESRDVEAGIQLYSWDRFREIRFYGERRWGRYRLFWRQRGMVRLLG